MCILCFQTLSRRGVGRLTAAIGALIFGQVGAPVPAWAQNRNAAPPREVAGVRIPDTDLARAATELVQTESDPFLFNHCMRTFLLASLYARRVGWSYDEELVFASSVLHDLGLVRKFESSAKVFEEAGADYARRFVVQFGFSPDRADRVWKGIAWHANNVPPNSPHDIELIEIGAAIDVIGGKHYDKIRPAEISAMLADYPRLRFKTAFKQTLAEHAIRQPAQAGWTMEFAQEPPSEFVKRVLNSPWPE